MVMHIFCMVLVVAKFMGDHRVGTRSYMALGAITESVTSSRKALFFHKDLSPDNAKYIISRVYIIC